MAPKRTASTLARLAFIASLVAAAFGVLAADLGKATVRSRIGQPLNAEIEVVSLKPGEDKTLAARLASRQAYQKAGLDFNRALADMHVTLARRGARRTVRLTSTKSLNETNLEALIQLRSSSGTVLRRYTIFLEPPGKRPSVAQALPLTAKPRPAKPKPVAKPPLPQPSTAQAAPLEPTAQAETSAPLSREALFGLPPREGAREGEPAKGREWRGFVQNTTAYDFREPKHWSRAVIRTQLGTQGGSGEFKWKAAARLDVDPVYFNSSFYPEPVKKDQRADLFLRETYLDAPLGPLQLRLGKQQIVWGEMVGLFFADVVSARDQRDFVLPDFEIIRIPQWAARIEHFGENSHAELIWLPYPEVDNIGKPGAEFYPFRASPLPGFDQQLNDDVGPRRNLKNTNLGLRASTLRSGWDLSAFYYRSTDVNPTFYRELAPGPVPTLVFTPRHDRIWQAGSTLAKDFGSVVGKAELIYAAGRKFNVTRLTEPEGVVPQKTLDYVVGLDFTLPRETRLNVQYFKRVFFNWDPDLLQDRREGGVTVLLSGKVGSLTPEVLIIQSVNHNDRLARWKLGWNAAKNWRLTLGVDVFHGPTTGLFGRFDDRDRGYVEARFDF